MNLDKLDKAIEEAVGKPMVKLNDLNIDGLLVEVFSDEFYITDLTDNAQVVISFEQFKEMLLLAERTGIL